jgi:hypothetical protein
MYEKQPIYLLNDIRSFYNDYRIIINYYYYDLNEYVLLNDIIFYFNNFKPLEQGIHDLFILKMDRLNTFKKMCLVKKCVYVLFHFLDNKIINTDKKIRFLLGVLTPIERKEFIDYFSIL